MPFVSLLSYGSTRIFATSLIIMHDEWAWSSRDTAACNMALLEIGLVIFGGIVTYLRIRGLLARSCTCTRYVCTRACVCVFVDLQLSYNIK